MMQAIPGQHPTRVDRPQDAWIAWAGRVGLYALLLFYQLNATVSYVGLDLMILVFILQTGRWLPILRGDPVVRVYLLLVLFVAGYARWAAHEFPETSAAQWMAVSNCMHWLAFIPVAWIVRAEKKHLNLMLLLLAAGVLARILIHVEWSQLGSIFRWPRLGFGLTETVFAPLAGITALGVLLLAPRLMGDTWRGVLLVGLGLIGLLIFLEALVLSQTRGVWLAAAVVYPVSLAVRYRDWLRRRAFQSTKSLLWLALALALVGVFIQQNSGFLINRIQAEHVEAEPGTARIAIVGDKEVKLATSIGYRVIMLRIGWQRWLERPWLGWGPGSSEWLLQQAGNPLLNQDVPMQNGKAFSLHLPHLHSVYLEVLVRFGVLGAVLFFALPVLLLRGVWKAYSAGAIPWDYACFLLAGWGFTAIVAVFDFQIFKFAWRNYCVIWAALSYAVYLEALLQRRPAA